MSRNRRDSAGAKAAAPGRTAMICAVGSDLGSESETFPNKIATVTGVPANDLRDVIAVMRTIVGQQRFTRRTPARMKKQQSSTAVFSFGGNAADG